MGWQEVRREVARLDWDAAAPGTPNVLAEWTHVVSMLVAIRRALGPVPAQDPLALLATATRGANGVRDATPTVGASLDGVRDALAGVLRGVEAGPVADRDRQVAAVTLVAYQLAHRVQVQVSDARVQAWLHAGESALDAALHAPRGRSATGAALAGWTDALAAVQPIAHTATVRRSVALGHVAVLRSLHALAGDAHQAGMLPPPYSDALQAAVRALAEGHQDTYRHTDTGPASRVDQAVMLRLGDAIRQLTAPPASGEPAHVRLDALLRSTVGQAVVVAHLTSDAHTQAAARTLQQLALEYVANPNMLRTTGPTASPVLPPPAGAPAFASRPHHGALPGSPAAGAAQPTIAPGTVLDGDTITALCRRRDLGAAAAVADVTDPPGVLRGIEPSRWPRLVEDGQQAVVDLVASVIPMVWDRARSSRNAADVRGEMFLQVMGAARTFDPAKSAPERWPHYVWVTLEHNRWRGVDPAGVLRGRHQSPPTFVTLGDREPASTAPTPEGIVEQRDTVRAINSALRDLPAQLLDPLLESIQGHSTRAIGSELGISASTVQRRITQAREQLRDQLAPLLNPDAAGPRYETVTPRNLDRSQRLHEQTHRPNPAHQPGPGLAR